MRGKDAMEPPLDQFTPAQAEQKNKEYHSWHFLGEHEYLPIVLH
jgi:hypothetical protein